MRPDKACQKLFVEGQTDGSVINKLIQLRLKISLSKPSSHQIIDVPQGGGGVDLAIKGFKDALAARRPERLGLVVDRDGCDDKPDRWISISQILENVGLCPPDKPPYDGIRIAAPWGRIGVWLMPDNRKVGDLESFLEELLPDPKPSIWEYAIEAVDGAKSRGAPYCDVHKSKAVFHTWLAWQNPPGNPYGTALEAGVLGVRSSSADAFVSWFEWLFGD